MYLGGGGHHRDLHHVHHQQLLLFILLLWFEKRTADSLSLSYGKKLSKVLKKTSHSSGESRVNRHFEM